jgi:starch synthase
VWRITRQKGLTHLLDAARHINPDAQLVLCAGAPDTPQIAAEIADKTTALQADHGNIIWIADMRPRPELIQILSHTDVFVCPSIYEPLGIVNLEAMACGAAVVASAVGGIPEVVVDGTTGKLVRYDAVSDGTGTPVDPDGFARDFAAAVNSVLADPAAAEAMGRAGRERAVQEFSWTTIAHETLDLYLSLS